MNSSRYTQNDAILIFWSWRSISKDPSFWKKKSFHFGGCSPKGANGVNTKGLGWRSETRRNLKLANDGIQFDEDISLQMSGDYPHHIVI